MDATLGHLNDFGDHVRIFGIHFVGGTEDLGHFQLVSINVNGDDAGRTRQVRGMDGGKTYPSAAEYCHSGTWFHTGTVNNRAIAGEHATAQQRRQFHRHVFVDFDQGVFVHQHLLGKGRQVQELVQMLPLPVQSFSLSGRHLDRCVAAYGLVASQAKLAVAAEHRQTSDDVVAWLDVSNIFTHRFNHPGSLMSQHCRHRGGVLALNKMQIAVTKTAHAGSHQHLISLGLVDFDILDGHWLTRAMKNSGFQLKISCKIVFFEGGGLSRCGRSSFKYSSGEIPISILLSCQFPMLFKRLHSCVIANHKLNTVSACSSRAESGRVRIGKPESMYLFKSALAKKDEPLPCVLGLTGQ